MKRPPDPQKAVNEFNEKFKVGDEIEYCSIMGDPYKKYRIVYPATILGGHTAVAWLDGVSGCVAVTHCRGPEGGEK